MKIEKKQKIAQTLKDKFQKSDAIILADYQGVNVESINFLRKKLGEVGVEFQVAKNSLLARASEGNPVELIKNDFKGPSAVAMCYDDPVISAKILTDFASDNKNFKIKAGILGNKVINIEAIRALASLPSREVLLTQFLLTINSVPSGLVTLLSGVIRNFVNILQAIKDQK